LVAGAEARVVLQVAPLPPDVAVTVADMGLAEESRLLASRHPPSGVDPDFYAMRVAASPSDWVGWRAQHASVLGRVPTTAEAARAFRLTVPVFFESSVRQSSSVNGIPEELIWSVMRKESDFRTNAVSGSDAMGLMQVIPQTALAIADRRGVAYVDGMLFEPHHAIEFGSWYLGALNDHFGNQLPLTIIAYNAGPLVVEDWLRRNGGMAHDEFVEEIPFDQARDYVRKVSEFMVEYIVSGGSDEVLNSATLGGLFPERIENRTNGVVDF
jgi:soluble lytic murein transglycosylase-like protein